MMSNLGVGLQMTDNRIHKEIERIGPGPQVYDVCSKLTDREKNRNELLSQRYKDWHRKHTSKGERVDAIRLKSEIQFRTFGELLICQSVRCQI
jgi:hypothetical protein